MSGITEVEFTAIVGEVCEHNTEINKASKDASTKTTNGCGSLRCLAFWCWSQQGQTHDFSKIYWGYDDGLTNTETGNEATGVDGPNAATVTHENGNSDDPKNTKLTSGPETTNAIADQEGTEEVKRVSDEQDSKLGVYGSSTYKRAPPTDPIWTMAVTFPLMLVCSTSLYDS